MTQSTACSKSSLLLDNISSLDAWLLCVCLRMHSHQLMVSKLNVLRTVKALEGATPHLTGIQVSV